MNAKNREKGKSPLLKGCEQSPQKVKLVQSVVFASNFSKDVDH